MGSAVCVSACWGLCDDSVITFRVSIRFPDSQGSERSEGSCSGDSSGCMGRKEIEAYALCDGTSPCELRCNSGLVSRVMGLSRLLRGEVCEYSEVLIIVILWEETRLRTGGLSGGGVFVTDNPCMSISVPKRSFSSSFVWPLLISSLLPLLC